MSETARNSDRVASPGGRCSISRERQLPHGNDRSSSFVISQMSFLSDKLQTSSLSERQNRQRSSSRFCYFIVRCLIRDLRIILIRKKKKKKRPTCLYFVHRGSVIEQGGINWKVNLQM